MRATATFIIFTCAIIAAIFSFISDDGFVKLSTLTRSLEQQQRTNSKLADTVQSLKREVHGLQSNPRAVEKAARSELGMARSDEVVVIFDKKDDAHAQGK